VGWFVCCDNVDICVVTVVTVMKMSQFVEYADMDRPGLKIVSCKQVQVYLNDNSYGVVFYIVVHAISPNRILNTPRFRCRFALGTNIGAEGFVFPNVLPVQGPVTAVDRNTGFVSREYPFLSYLTKDDGSTMTILSSVDRVNIFPLQTLEGTIYFEVTKTKAQRVFNQVVEIF
jgi:hypothetical protein